MMHIDIITCQPDLLSGPFSESIVKRAIERGLVHIDIHNLRDYSNDKHRKVDDYAYGGGAGMVLMIEPIDNCIQSLKQKRSYDEIIQEYPPSINVQLSQGTFLRKQYEQWNGRKRK